MKTQIAEFPKHPLPQPPEPSQPLRVQTPTVYVYEPQQWEYQIISRSVGVEVTISTDELNALGKDGWELVGVVTLPATVQFFFKRLKS